MRVFEVPSGRLISVIFVGVPNAINELIGDEPLVVAEKPRSAPKLVPFELAAKA